MPFVGIDDLDSWSHSLVYKFFYSLSALFQELQFLFTATHIFCFFGCVSSTSQLFFHWVNHLYCDVYSLFIPTELKGSCV